MNDLKECPFCTNVYSIRLLLAKHIMMMHPEKAELLIDDSLATIDWVKETLEPLRA